MLGVIPSYLCAVPGQKLHLQGLVLLLALLSCQTSDPCLPHLSGLLQFRRPEWTVGFAHVLTSWYGLQCMMTCGDES